MLNRHLILKQLITFFKKLTIFALLCLRVIGPKKLNTVTSEIITLKSQQRNNTFKEREL